MKKTILSCLLLGMLTGSAFADNFKAASADITYTGRTLANEDGSVSYDWVGVYLQTEFTGTSISVSLSETGTSYHNIFIDGKLIEKRKITGNEPHTEVLASHLKKGKHLLRLQKCTEGQYGCTTIYSITTDKGCKLKGVEKKSRYIAIVGDSYTCGYGTESERAEDHFSIDTENCNKAYGCLVAEYFDADYMLTSHSGQGMCHDWGDTVQVSKENMFTRFDQVFDMRKEPKYDFSQRTPDLYIINLGTNDWGAGWLPSIEQYVGNYVELIKRIRVIYGNVPVLCITPHSANAFTLTALQELKKEVEHIDNVHMATPMPDIVVYGMDYGADYHPNYQGQRKIAMTLIPRISAITGWSLPELKR